MKKNINRILFLGMISSLLLVLSGCVSRNSSGNPTGIIWNFLGKPMGDLIKFFANDLNLGFGLAILLVTTIVRFIILPLGLYQARKASYHSERLAYLKPVLEPFNERMRNAQSQEEKLAAQSALMAAQKENGVSPLGGIGCLPLLIQMPFFSAMYFAAQYTDGVSKSSFLGINLGERSLILTVIIMALYLFQSWLSIKSVPEEQRAQMKTMMFMMPIMMGFMSSSLPSSVALYWLIGGVFSIIQQLITMFIIKPRLHQQVADEFEKNPPKSYPSTSRKDVTPPSKTPAQTHSSLPKKRNRNAGKQHKKKN